MIEVREAFPLWVWLAFGSFGMIIFIIFVSLILNIIKTASRDQRLRPALQWFLVGFVLVFCSKWIMCGLGYPGFTASDNPYFFSLTTARNTALITGAMSMTLSLTSWICFLIGARRLFRMVD
jgi:phosphoglycerol transferase MdoB-like AlkP superfamily enzyme